MKKKQKKTKEYGEIGAIAVFIVIIFLIALSIGFYGNTQEVTKELCKEKGYETGKATTGFTSELTITCCKEANIITTEGNTIKGETIRLCKEILKK